MYCNLRTIDDQVINILLQCVRHPLEIMKARCEFSVFQVQRMESRAKILFHFLQLICCLECERFEDQS